MLLVILGAGASNDSHPDEPGTSNAYRLPLADQLFATGYSEQLSSFRDLAGIVPRLRYRESGTSVEQELEQLSKEAKGDPIRASQLMAVRFYLQVLIGGLDYEWWRVHRGVSSHGSLLEEIRTSRQAKEPVLIVTFNYDRLIEWVLERWGYAIRSLDDYISGDKVKVFKVHGSVNWVREVETPIEIENTNP